MAETHTVEGGSDFFVGSLSFDTSNEDAPANVGTAAWNDAERTLDLRVSDDVVMQVGQELYTPRTTNKTGADIGNGKVVYVDGAQGQRPKIWLADADSYVTSQKVIGLTTEAIADNAEGFVTTHGLVRDIDTSGFGVGDCLYLSTTAGAMTNTAPADGKIRIVVGMCVVSHATQGVVCVRVREEKYMFGDVDGGNYSYFESDGTLVHVGDARTWTDLSVPLTLDKQGQTSKPDYDYTELGLLFPQNDATEIAYMTFQMPHQKALDTAIRLHVHYVQSNATQPTFKVDYRFYNNGSAVPGAWTTLSTADGSKGVFSYTSGSILQIATFTDIAAPSSEDVSANLDVKLYRDDNDLAGDVLAKYIDLHYQVNTAGSRDEYTK